MHKTYCFDIHLWLFLKVTKTWILSILYHGHSTKPRGIWLPTYVSISNHLAMIWLCTCDPSCQLESMGIYKAFACKQTHLILFCVSCYKIVPLHASKNNFNWNFHLGVFSPVSFILPQWLYMYHHINVEIEISACTETEYSTFREFSWLCIFLNIVEDVPGRRLHKPQWYRRKVHLRQEIWWWEFYPKTYRTRSEILNSPT